MAKLRFKDYVIRKPKGWAGLIDLLNAGWAIHWDDRYENIFYFILVADGDTE